MFVRYEEGIKRLRELSRNQVSFLDDYVLCHRCKVAVEKCPEKIRSPFLGETGFYCPECGELLLKAKRKQR